MSNRLIRQEIYDKLRSDILSCSLLPGEEFREGELVEKFGVSKSPIRDALQRLELEGLVEITPRRGHRVAPISVADAQDMLDMREILEAGALRLAIDRASDTELKLLDNFRAADTDDLGAFADYNRRFHRTLCDVSQNQRIATSMALLMENYDRLCIVSLTSTRDLEGGMEEALTDHISIIEALQTRNVAAAVRASRRHTKKSRGKIMRGLENRPVVA
jgi:DNA-binding GntR family transcriptional regulator